MEQKKDVIRPSYYAGHKTEVIEFIQDWDFNFCLGNVIKYICRAGRKGNRLEDLQKAAQYLAFEIEAEERTEKGEVAAWTEQ